MGEVSRIEPAEVAVSETAAIVQVIERAAANPNVDIDKLERLLQMQERIMERNARAAFTSALAEMQPELPVISERGKIDLGRGKPQHYALWEDINEAIRPILSKYGFTLSFRTGHEGDRITVTGVLAHRSGHSEQTTMMLPVDNSGSKNAVQGVGSSTSYGKRYTTIALLNLTSRGEDDNGRSAGGGEPLSDEQVKVLQDLIIEVGADPIRFCRYLKVSDLKLLPASRFAEAKRALEGKGNAS